jgi:hypothetical protein
VAARSAVHRPDGPTVFAPLFLSIWKRVDPDHAFFAGVILVIPFHDKNASVAGHRRAQDAVVEFLDDSSVGNLFRA